MLVGYPLRAPPLARNRGLRRRGDGRALALHRLPDHHARQHRPADCSTISSANSWCCRARRIANFTWAVFAALGVILSACYMLWMYQRVFYGEAPEDVRASHARSERARMGGHRSAARPDGLDGRLRADASCRRSARRTRAILEQTNVNVPFRVQRSRPRRAPRRSPMPANFVPNRAELPALPAGNHSDRRRHAAHGARSRARRQARVDAFGASQHRRAAGRARRRRLRRTAIPDRRSAAC